MTLNRPIALILHYFTEFDSFGADYFNVIEDSESSIISAEYGLPLLAKIDPLCSAVSLRCASYMIRCAKRCQ